MYLIYNVKSFCLVVALVGFACLFSPGTCPSTDPEDHSHSNLKPFLDTVSVFKNDVVGENTDDLEAEFNLNPEDKVKLNLDSRFDKGDDGLNFEEFKNATEVFGKDDWGLANENGDTGEKEVLVNPEEVSADRYRDDPEMGYSSTNHSGGDILIVDPKSDESTKHANVAKRTESRCPMAALRDDQNGKDSESSRRLLKLNLEPEGGEDAGEVDLEEDMITTKMLEMISRIRRLKTEVISKNSEIDSIFSEVAELRGVVNETNNLSYYAMFKELETLSKDLNLLRKGNIFTGYADNILGNITVMEAFHGLYVIYRTPFILLRHNSKLYAKMESHVYDLFKNKVPSAMKSARGKVKKSLGGWIERTYGKTLKLARLIHVYHSVTKRTVSIYDLLLTDFIRDNFEVDVTEFNYTGNSKVVLKVGQALTKVKVRKHYRYIRHCVINNKKIEASYLNRNHFPGFSSNMDLMYITDKDYMMLEVLYNIYKLKSVCVGYKVALKALRYTALLLNVFVKDEEKGYNRYTKPFVKLREDSFFKLDNLYVLLRSASIYALQKLDVFMDHCFNYANKLNPELATLVPRDLSNRIFFLSVVILLTFLLIFLAQQLIHGLVTLVTSPFTTRSRSSLHSRLRHWYHRSHVRQLAHVLKRNLSSHGKQHKKKHKYHRNFENLHRIIDDGNVTNSDNYKQFKTASRSN
ncbi:hypothetical protein MACK_001781 [Theileria orientalis]|uniref:Uncharacterized protein n=1 Tax=Theileria orientalis TaxID=68886 RepID=A0A976MAK8_THEOR|nr:hypothetical protein MACK_001781 [Theileria orientalis]